MKFILLTIGILLFSTGLLWVGQGLGYLKWPSSSFMINQIEWVYYGGGLIIVGLILVGLSRR